MGTCYVPGAPVSLVGSRLTLGVGGGLVLGLSSRQYLQALVERDRQLLESVWTPGFMLLGGLTCGNLHGKGKQWEREERGLALELDGTGYKCQFHHYLMVGLWVNS